MEITRSIQAGVVDLAIEGRLDSSWAHHLDGALSELVREGHDRIQLDLSKTTFLSSAGVAVLMKYYKQIGRINGALVVSEASDAVKQVLDMTRLTAILFKPSQSAPAPAAVENRMLERAGARFEIFDLNPKGSLTCRTIGSPQSLAAPGSSEGYEVACHESLFMVGIGGIGRTFADCRDRFGDLLAVGGAVVYQPADGTNAPDYLVGERGAGGQSGASQVPDARMLYGLACEGAFTSLARFESSANAGAASLAGLADTCLELSGAPAAGVVIVAEVAGLVGAALRRSPFVLAGEASAGGAADPFFAHPRVRERLTFTAERAFARSVALIVGIVAKPDAPGDHSQLRPLGGASTAVGHFHAAAFPFRPFRKGRIEVADTVTTLFESERVLGVLHLLNDDRAGGGAGLSELVRGACWTAPIRGWV